MKDAHPEKIRNIALVGHQSTGKTILTESMLHRMSAITRMGTIEDGNTVSDYHSDEVSRQLSISSTLVVGDFKGTKINIIDTPGFTDFMGEVKCAVRVADSIGVLIHSTSGIEVGTELVWGFAEELDVPRFFYINQLDRENADFGVVAGSLAKRFGSAVVLQYPVDPGNENFKQIIDLLTMKLVTWNPDGGVKSRADIPGDLKDEANSKRQEMIESIAETDDKLMERFFENDGLTDDELLNGLKDGFLKGSVFPVLCGASKHSVGTSLLLDFLVEIAPNPTEMPDQKATRFESSDAVAIPVNPDSNTSALVFKTVSDKHVGDLSFFKVYSGSLNSGEDLKNTTQNKNEKIGQIFNVSGKIRKSVDSVHAGDMGALVKLKDTHTGDTLASLKDSVILEGIDFPVPVTRIAVVPRNKGDEEKISNAMHILAEEDPSFIFNYDAELQQLIVAGQGELHLKIVMERLRERFGVEVDEAEPKIPYRETIRSSAEGQGKYKKQSGGRGQYGDCWLRLESAGRGGGFEFVNAIVGGVIPGKFIPAVEKGVVGAMADGAIAGFPVVDVKVTCYDGSFHTVDSSENAFKVAASMGFKKVFKEARPVILEPIEDVEVRVPEKYMGDVMGDISAKRGKIMGMDHEGSSQVIRAKVPLSELFKYSSVLRSLTGGRGLYKSSFSHYEEVPSEIQLKLVNDYEERRAEGIS